MVPLHMAGFPGKHKGSLSNFTAPILTAARDVIYPVLITANAEVPTVFILVNILPIFSAFPNHVGINIGDSLHSTNSNVFSRQQTCHQRNPKHYILRIWNCYIVADHVWCQVSFACKNDLISKETVVLPRRESQTLKFRVNADINNQLKKDHKLTFGPLALRESEWFKSVASDRCIICYSYWFIFLSVSFLEASFSTESWRYFLFLLSFRLPIVQGGGSLAFVGPTFSILSLPQWRCPDLSGKLTSTKAVFFNFTFF